jgi:hypothetical protein
MVLPSYMRSFVEWNVVMRHMTIYHLRFGRCCNLHQGTLTRILIKYKELPICVTPLECGNGDGNTNNTWYNILYRRAFVGLPHNLDNPPSNARIWNITLVLSSAVTYVCLHLMTSSSVRFGHQCSKITAINVQDGQTVLPSSACSVPGVMACGCE